MHVNYEYVLNFSARIAAANGRDIVILDYGCGDGTVIEEGRKRGLNFFGAEIFYAGGNRRKEVEEKGLLGNTIKEIKNDRIDFPDSYFDMVVSNQVFEHVENLAIVCKEIHRVLKPGGILLAFFPSKDVWREGHCGIPFLHWFRKNSQGRVYYAYILRSLGFGYFKEGKSKYLWAKQFCEWLDKYTYYRSRREIEVNFESYKLEYIEHDYIEYRAQRNRILSRVSFLFGMPIIEPISNELFRKLGGLVIKATKA